MQNEGRRNNGTEVPGIVTPEAVVLDFDTAGLGSRTAARLLDTALQGLVAGLAGLVLAQLGEAGGPAWIGVVVGLFLVFAVIFVYPALFETFWNGKTPGKAALGLQVVTIEGGPVAFRHAAIRSALGVVELFASGGAIAALVVFFSKRSQRLGDILAGTLVLRQRSGTDLPSSIRFVPNPGTEAFVATIDVSALSSGEYQAIRSFLLRSRTLTPSARDDLAVELGNRMASKLRLTPPAGMTPIDLLIGIAAMYQQRFQRGEAAR